MTLIYQAMHTVYNVIVLIMRFIGIKIRATVCTQKLALRIRYKCKFNKYSTIVFCIKYKNTTEYQYSNYCLNSL